MNQKELKQIAKTCAEKIKNSEKGVNNFQIPFAHLVLDNFFPKNRLQPESKKKSLNELISQ